MIILKKTIRFRGLFKIAFLSGMMFCSVQAIQAQVTIGSNQTPNQNALLDLKQDGTTTKGLLLPRVALVQTSLPNPMSAHVAGMVVYNTATSVDVSPGHYYNNGSKWLRIFSAEDTFFYMPPTVLPTDESDSAFDGTKFTVNLYSVYNTQFGLSAANKAVSNAAATLPVYASNKLDYFVTYYDADVFTDVAISTAGVLTYKLKANYVYTEKTFMNIICKVK